MRFWMSWRWFLLRLRLAFTCFCCRRSSWNSFLDRTCYPPGRVARLRWLCFESELNANRRLRTLTSILRCQPCLPGSPQAATDETRLGFQGSPSHLLGVCIGPCSGMPLELEFEPIFLVTMLDDVSKSS